MTHTELITLSAAWLRAQNCSVVITDMTHGGSETPDAIGWQRTDSILIECKASRADFLADRHKPFRRDPERGMGMLRYYATPEGLLKPEDRPRAGDCSKPKTANCAGKFMRHGKKPPRQIGARLRAAQRKSACCCPPCAASARPAPRVSPCGPTPSSPPQPKNRATLGTLPLEETA